MSTPVFGKDYRVVESDRQTIQYELNHHYKHYKLWGPGESDSQMLFRWVRFKLENWYTTYNTASPLEWYFSIHNGTNSQDFIWAVNVSPTADNWLASASNKRHQTTVKWDPSTTFNTTIMTSSDARYGRVGMISGGVTFEPTSLSSIENTTSSTSWEAFVYKFVVPARRAVTYKMFWDRSYHGDHAQISVEAVV